MESKTLKGQAWIQGDQLVQEQVLVVPGQATSTAVVTVIDNIWEDLKSETGKWKTNDKGYFYWEYKQTDISNDDVEVTVKLECPRPKEDTFEYPYNPESVSGKWAKYWVERLKTASENYEKAYAIQRKEITFRGGRTRFTLDGKIITSPEITISNPDTDMANFLNIF